MHRFRIAFRCLSSSSLLAAVLLAAGCGFGPSAGKVKGTVSLGGQPVTKGNVNFLLKEKGVGAVAAIDASGNYSFDTPLEAGTYAVYLTQAAPEPSAPGKPAARMARDIPARYLDPATSQLTFTVKKGANEYPITLQK